jgi:hypothetical protein
MRGLIALCFAALLLAGCTTQADFTKKLDSWVGSKETELISSWGPPNGFYETEGTKYITYGNSSVGTMPGTSNYNTQIIGNTAYTTG